MSKPVISIILKVGALLVLLAILAWALGYSLPFTTDVSTPAPQTAQEETNTNKVEVWKNILSIGPKDISGTDDLANEFGPYTTTTDPDIYIPFLNLDAVEKKDWSGAEADKLFVLSAPLPINEADYISKQPDSTDSVSFDTGGNMQTSEKETQKTVQDKRVYLSFNKEILENYTTDKAIGTDCAQTEIKPTLSPTWKHIINVILSRARGIRKDPAQTLEPIQAPCFEYRASLLKHNEGYLVVTEKGNSLKLEVRDDAKKQIIKSFTITSSPLYFVLMPQEGEDLGYTSIISSDKKKNLTPSSLPSLRLASIPVNEIRGLRYVKNGVSITKPEQINNFAAYEQSGKYTVNFVPANTTVVMKEEYKAGWKMYEVSTILGEYLPFIFGSEVKTHRSMQGFNSWYVKESIPDSSYFLILYWPDYRNLVFIAILFFMVVALITASYLVIRNKFSSTDQGA